MGLTPETETALIEMVRHVARAEILPRFRRLDAADIRAKSGPADLVTEADVRAEAAMTEALAHVMPGALVIGEEAVSEDPRRLDGLAEAERAVLLDPVDGTWNFAKGLATFGVILTVMERGAPVFGLLYDVVMDDWVLARRGGGSWLCAPDRAPRRLQLSQEAASDGATGFLPLFMFPPETRPAWVAPRQGIQRTVSLFCSCHEYRLMAQGFADFCLSAPKHNPWDHAAGHLAVREAGGATGVLTGGAYGGTETEGVLVAARNQTILDQIRAAFDGVAAG
ncbi:MAG: inositol monophosphatase [Silicimonas sp.]|nr:inositol monophosphatase [Silicimonas sp.]